MRRRLVLGTVAVIVVVLAVLVPPVVILLRQTAERELQVRLSSQAAAVSTTIADELLQGQAPTISRIARFVTPDDQLVVLDSDGVVLLRYGADVSSPISGSAGGPVGTRILMSTSDTALSERVRGPLLALGAFAIVSIGLGALLAGLVARRLTRPLVHLARAAERLGAGDFSAEMPTASGTPEIDGISAALGASAERLEQMLAAERSFTGDATHQLRTGLAGIGLRLELLSVHPAADVRSEAAHAQAQLDRLVLSLDELLALARGGTGGQRTEVDVRALVAEHCVDWRVRCQQTRRPLELIGSSPPWRATPGFIGQIVDVLVDNALRHGSGVITISLAERSLTVRDEGAIDVATIDRLFVPTNDPHGRGLDLARRLARADGGDLDLVVASPTTFAVSYPHITLERVKPG